MPRAHRQLKAKKKEVTTPMPPLRKILSFDISKPLATYGGVMDLVLPHQAELLTVRFDRRWNLRLYVSAITAIGHPQCTHELAVYPTGHESPNHQLQHIGSDYYVDDDDIERMYHVFIGPGDLINAVVRPQSKELRG